VATHWHPSQPSRDRWLIPGALGFLALAVLSAIVMLVYPFGGDGAPPPPVPVAAGSSTPSPAGAPSQARSPSPSPSPSPSVDGAFVRSVVTGLCLSVAEGDPEGAVAQQQACGDKPGQRWRQVAAGDAVTLVNVASGKCLDVANRGTDDGARVQTWTCNNGPNQQWRPQPAAGGTLLVSVNSGKCLDVPDGQNGPGVPLQQWTCHGRANQQWVIGG
jgi:hypothetical protein